MWKRCFEKPSAWSSSWITVWEKKTEMSIQTHSNKFKTDRSIKLHLYGNLVAVCGPCQSVPADDHHPGHRSPMGVRLAVDSVGQDVRL